MVTSLKIRHATDALKELVIVPHCRPVLLGTLHIKLYLYRRFFFISVASLNIRHTTGVINETGHRTPL